MPFPWIAAALISTAISTTASVAASVEAQQAEKERAKVQRATQELQRRKETRRTIAQARLQRAELIQGGVETGSRTNSAVSGAVSSLNSTTAGNIGYANTVFAGNQLQNDIMSSASRKIAGLQTFGSAAAGAANMFSVGGQAAAMNRQNQAVTSSYAAGNRPLNTSYLDNVLPGNTTIPWSIRRPG